MRRVRSMGAALAAMFVLGAVTAAGAWAAGEGPGWHVHLDRCKKWPKGAPTPAARNAPPKKTRGASRRGGTTTGRTLYRLGAGEELPFTSHGENVVLRTSGIEISCKTLPSEGTVIGGSPGKDTLTVVFAECCVVGYPNCKVMSKASSLPPWGTIELAAKMELVYTGTKAQAEKEEAPVGALLAPASGSKFVLLAFEGDVRCHQAAK